MFFWTDNGNSGAELWRTDGTAAGNTTVKNFDVVPGQVVSLDDALFFEWAGRLGRSDGTTAGTAPVPPVADGLYDMVRRVLDVNGTLFFFDRYGLWKSDGTSAGTTHVKDFGVTGEMAAVNKTLFFADGYGGLWKSDGTWA